ncbi:Xaa-Pro aminopeptidase [Devosia sp. YR412]|uniref:M24 family metallopeptidase n=1 Tax=Devosia sp. YR412 TaxID=1881030 RepID=UPI0008D0F235|nr:Xaa-Pro peptidase family protein [Devosia sp. YR412]SEQ40640.1 Xaa-Pro aminopeptidase [Devosia sp. YR412]
MTLVLPIVQPVKPLGASFRQAVRDRLLQAAAARGLDGVLLLSPANVFYACGFHFSVNERPVGLYVPVDGEPTLFIPLLELENAQPTPGVSLGVYEEFPGLVHPVVWMVCQSKANRIAIDGLDARQIAPLNTLLDELVLEDLIAPQRYIKTAEELVLTRIAASYADLCLERLLAEAGNIIAQGGSELDLHADCTGFALAALKRDYGAAFAGSKLAVAASVHSGPRCALPHGATSHRQPLAGETIICGVGATLGGYHAESGVTLFTGEITAEHRRVMIAMDACNDAAVAALKPGARCQDVNEAALDALKAADLGDAIRHRIGHGMGVEGHEAPWLAPGDMTEVAPSMVFSNEPGVYRPERDGYRTINTMLVQPDGVEIPSRFQADHPIEQRVIAL